MENLKMKMENLEPENKSKSENKNRFMRLICAAEINHKKNEKNEELKIVCKL